MKASRSAQFLIAVISALAASLGLYFGYQSLVAWTFDGLARGARDMGDSWPLVLFSILAALCIFAVEAQARRRAWIAPLALSVIGWSLGLVSIADLPDFPSAQNLGAGPVLRAGYLVLILVSGWFAFGGPVFARGRLRFDWPLAERALLLFTFWGTANGKLLARETNPGFAMLNLAGLLTIALLARGVGLREIFHRARRRLGIGSLLVFGALPIWWFVAAVLASNREPALQLAWRLFVAAFVALVAIGSIGFGEASSQGRQVARRLFGALVLGLAVVLVGAVLGIAEASSIQPLEHVLSSRLRVLGLHPNLGAALFAAGLPLVLGWIFLGQAKSLSPVRRGAGSLLFAGCVVGLYLAASRTSGLGAVVGLLAFGLFFFTRLPSLLGPRVWLGLGVTIAVGLVLFLSPLGAELRAALDAKAQIQSALGQRWHLWRMASAALLDHPVSGLGPLGFGGHAQYALTSYYNGTSQTLHPHNIFMAAAEGAGWIGLGLFVLWLGALFELLRRAVVASPKGHRDRALGAGVFASVLALLVCNQLDLGQSQLTFVPLLFWSAVTLGGLQCGAGRVVDSRISKQTLGSGLLVLLLLWPAVGATLVGLGRRIDGQVAAFEGKTERASQIYTRLLSAPFLADDIELTRRLAAIAKRIKQPDWELSLHANLAKSLLDSPQVKRRFAEALVSAGRYQKGLEVAQSARALDPFGQTAAPALMLEAWASLGLGQSETGLEQLLAAIESGAVIPGELLDQLDALLGGGDLVMRLEQVGNAIVQQAATDQVTARRRLAGLAQAFQALGAADRIIPIVKGVITASPNPIRATYYQLIVQLIELGRDEEAKQVLTSSPFGREVAFAEIFSGLKASKWNTAGETPDIFFTADRLAQRYLRLALDFVAKGELQAARRELARALYNASEPSGRVDLVLAYMQDADDSKMSRLWQLEMYLDRASVAKRRVSDLDSMVKALRLAAPAFGGTAQLGKHFQGKLEGPMAATFKAALGQLKR